MTGDEMGLSFFAPHSPIPPSGRPSAFAPVDQNAVIARIDAVDDDDLDSTFFGEAIIDVENAATRSFDIGIRMLGDADPAHYGQSPVEASPLTTAGIDATPAPAANPTEVPVVGRLGLGTAARSAFILHGPAGLTA
ncbi:MAG: hypothetical protein Q7V58_08235 [Actinomycetota bacterium]|nr:hypothetical protein [Actinomycetota bacterium]